MRRTVGVLLLLAAACASARRPPVGERSLGPPVFDAGRGWGSFPLAGDAMPETPEELAASLAAGLDERLELPDGARVVEVEKGREPRLEAVRIDATGSRIDPAYVPSRFAAEALVERVYAVGCVEYRADPLFLAEAAVSLRLWARDATLLGMRDRKERPSLVLGGAEEGGFEISLPAEDLKRAFQEGLRRRGARLLVSVESSELTLASPHPRCLEMDAKVRARWLLVRMELTITGRMEVDENFVATFTDVRCRGEDAGGRLMAGLVDSKLARAEQKRLPLMAFPDGRTRARAFAFDLSDGIRMSVGFGREGALSPPGSPERGRGVAGPAPTEG
ncbi:MAG: hypothetical protein ACT4PV_11750 [Planctomycetaceae bacterium]